MRCDQAGLGKAVPGQGGQEEDWASGASPHSAPSSTSVLFVRLFFQNLPSWRPGKPRDYSADANRQVWIPLILVS